MEPFITVTGIAAPLPRANVDTDQIMPKQFLKGIDRSGLADGFLFDLRFSRAGRMPRTGFILNREPWSDARVPGRRSELRLRVEPRACGVGHAPARHPRVVGTQFGGIFYDNCLRNGVPAISLPPEEVNRLLALASDPATCTFIVDLDAQTITTPGDGKPLPFDFDPLRKTMLLNGLDAVGLTLEHRDEIASFQARYFAARPWAA